MTFRLDIVGQHGVQQYFDDMEEMLDALQVVVKTGAVVQVETVPDVGVEQPVQGAGDAPDAPADADDTPIPLPVDSDGNTDADQADAGDAEGTDTNTDDTQGEDDDESGNDPESDSEPDSDSAGAEPTEEDGAAHSA